MSVDVYNQLHPSQPFLHSYLNSILPQQKATSLYNTRVRGRPIVLANPARESRAHKAIREARHRRKQQKARSALRTTSGIWLPHDSPHLTFEMFLPLHHLWLGYISELFSLSAPGTDDASHKRAFRAVTAAGIQPKLVKADFHGSIILGAILLQLEDNACSSRQQFVPATTPPLYACPDSCWKNLKTPSESSHNSTL
jgi:ribonuclease P protein subunit POP4